MGKHHKHELNRNIKSERNAAHSPSSSTNRRGGKVTRNPFLNFLRDFRTQNSSLTIIQAAVQGGREWNEMSTDERSPYVQMAARVAKPKKRTNILMNLYRRHRRHEF